MTKYKLINLIMLGAILLIGCSYDTPDSVWEESKKWEEIVPVINSVSPQPAGTASEITISGSDFSPQAEQNKVYFNNVLATIKEASASELVVYRPDIVGDSIIIKVVVNNAIAVAKYEQNYPMDTVVMDFGIFLSTDAMLSFCLDEAENVYVIMLDGSVVKFTPQGNRDESFQAEAHRFATDLKIGADGYFYFLRKRDVVYRIGPEGGEYTEYVSFPDRAKAEYFDFDREGNMFAGGEETGLLWLNISTAEVKALGEYDNFEIYTVRVYNNEVYVAAGQLNEDGDVYNRSIWKNAITDNSKGSIDSKVRVFDVTASANYSEALINDITFDADGKLYVATDDSTLSALFTIDENDEAAPYLYEMIPASLDQFRWGNDTYLYAMINRRAGFSDDESPRGHFLRIDMGKKGAPYNGRGLAR